MTASVITEVLNGILMELTPTERWAAARQFNSNFMAERWFAIIGMIAIIILTVLLFVVSFKRTRQERKSSEKLFIEYAEKRGLTVRERQILIEIARKAGLKRNEFIFTMAAAFDRGVAMVMEQGMEGQLGTQQNSQLKTEISVLCEKLGFRKRWLSSARSTKLSSRQIPVGKKVRMTRRKAYDSDDIGSTVIKSSDSELSLKLENPVKINFGELWCVRYYFGSSIWEFDTSIISYDGDVLVLNHSDNVRFINRRRFLRVPVRKPAFIARFPFAKSSEQVCEPPSFVPAVISELAGPGLRIESSLDLKEGERVLVVFNMEEDSIPVDGNGDSAGSEIVEDIGEVRRADTTKDGSSIAVELMGLSDSNLDELVRATNAASLSVNDRNENMVTSGNAIGDIPEYAANRGV